MPKYSVGQQVLHRLFHYRGLIFEADAEFLGTEEWYETVAKTRPPKDAPWYHILVHGAEHTTYVAERNLMQYDGTEYIDHPLLPALFDGFEDGIYHRRR